MRGARCGGGRLLLPVAICFLLVLLTFLPSKVCHSFFSAIIFVAITPHPSASSYLGSSDSVLPPQNKDLGWFSRPFWSLQLIGSGVSQASRPVTLMWHFRTEHLVTSLFVCQIPACLACCSSQLIKVLVITLYYKAQIHAVTLLQSCH